MVRPLLAAVGAVVVLSIASGARVGDPDAGKAKAQAAGCMDCHGSLGVSSEPTIPNLAGQNEIYLVRQLTEFRRPPSSRRLPKRRARRSDHIMTRQAELLTDTDIADLVAWFTTLWCGSSGKETSAEPPKVVARCTSCHGPSGMSEEDNIPKLAGQKQDYLAKQLRLFRESADGPTRTDAESVRFHPLMDNEAVKLTDADVDSLAAYFSGQSCW